MFNNFSIAELSVLRISIYTIVLAIFIYCIYKLGTWAGEYFFHMSVEV